MSKDTIDNFVAWLNEQENLKGWTDYRLAMEAKINPSVISRARSGIIPKWEACVAIATAFKVSPITAFRKAGLLPAEGTETASLRDWVYLLDKLPVDEQEEIRQIIEMKIDRRQKNEQAERSSKFKPKKAG